MNYSHELDLLQEMAVKYAGEPQKVYLIQLLAEHVEEDEMTAEFLEWVNETLNGPLNKLD